ncbi:MAG: hypothetical protein JST92_18230 [Deltaproteobacteria bacterium]|nr:hypothetical protein [Deltaproteobacteria bacterium]
MRHPTALLLAYDGAPFRGWQSQPGKPTIQDAVERALAQALGGKVQVFGAARTDAGVHAEGQVCHFVRQKLDSTSALVELMETLPKHLPAGLTLKSAALAQQSFHARASSVGKRYVYRFAWGPESMQDARAFPLGEAAQPQWERARKALEGVLDLTELPGLSSPSTDRRPAPGLTGFSLDETANSASLELRAPAFRKHQVRNVAGHLAAIALGLAEPESLRTLAQRKRPWMGAQAPARGLTLVEVVYPPELAPFNRAL